MRHKSSFDFASYSNIPKKMHATYGNYDMEVRYLVRNVLEGEDIDPVRRDRCLGYLHEFQTLTVAGSIFEDILGSEFEAHIPRQIRGDRSYWHDETRHEPVVIMSDCNAYWSQLKTYRKLCRKVDKMFSYLNTPGVWLNPDGTQALSVIDFGLSKWNEYLDENTVKDVAKSIVKDISRTFYNNVVEEPDKVQKQVLRTIGSIVAADKQTGSQLYERSLEEPLLHEIHDLFELRATYLENTSLRECVLQFLEMLNLAGRNASRFMPRSKLKILRTASEAMTAQYRDRYEDICENEDDLMIVPPTEYHFNDTLLLFNFSATAKVKLLISYSRYLDSLYNRVYKDVIVGRIKIKEMFKRIINIHQKQLKLIFLGTSDKSFMHVLNQALSKILDLCKNFGSIPQLLADYCHEVLMEMAHVDKRRWGKILTGIVSLFQIIDDKDAFLLAYWKWMTFRLMRMSSSLMKMPGKWSVGAELIAMTKLRHIYNNEHSRRIKMITDKMRECHTKWCGKFIQDLRKFNELIVLTDIWPLMVPQYNFNIPQQLLNHIQDFEATFDKKDSDLIWAHSYTTCEVNMNFRNKIYVMHTSLPIMTIIDLFNDTPAISFIDISTATNIPMDDLLVFMKLVVDCKLLLCENDQVTTSSTFTVNEEFHFEGEVLRILPPFREAKEEEKDLEAAKYLPFPSDNQLIVEETIVTREPVDKEAYLLALIFRVVRGNIQLKHEELIADVIHLSADRYIPSETCILNAIKHLIDMEYMEKVDEEYRYVP